MSVSRLPLRQTSPPHTRLRPTRLRPTRLRTEGGLVAVSFVAILLSVAGCATASGGSSAADAIWVRLMNPTPMEVQVQLVRAAGGYTWQQTVAPGADRLYVIPHRAFGNASMRVKLIRWPDSRSLRTVYAHRGDLDVEPGWVLLVRLESDLRKSQVFLDRPENRLRHLDEAESVAWAADPGR